MDIQTLALINLEKDLVIMRLKGTIELLQDKIKELEAGKEKGEE